MIRLFQGMIVGAMSAILAADGTATADRIIMNAEKIVHQSANQPDMFLLLAGGWGMVVISRTFWKRRQKPSQASKYSFLLR